MVCGLLMHGPVSAEQNESAGKPSIRKKARELSPVQELLSKATYLTRKKPNLKARYYGFLRSASWCVPCQVYVPQLLDDYSRMKGAKLELILLGQEDEAVVKKYMKEHKYNIPGVMPQNLGSVPGVSLCIVDADGNFVAVSGGKNMQNWRQQIKDYQSEQRKQKLLEKKDAMRDSDSE